MRLIHRLDAQGLPPEDLEFRLAVHLLGSPGALLRQVLTRLVAVPKRFSELRPLLAGKSDNNLTLALRRLRAEGLIDQRVDPRNPNDALVYELTELGVAVLFTMENLEFAHAAQALTRTSPAGQARVTAPARPRRGLV